jgi:ribose transport system permease protein
MFVNIMKLQAPRALAALALLVLVGGIFAPGTVTAGVWIAMLPFVAILGFAALGQHLVIQQGGFDLSVAGVISLAAVIVTLAPGDAGVGTILLYVAYALGAGLVAGLVSGAAVAYLGIAPIVTTIGTNALLLGATLSLSGGVPKSAPQGLIDFATSRIAGLSSIFVLLIVVVAIIAIILNKSVVGRRFVAVGTNPATARGLAISVNRYRLLTYGVAGLLFAVAGILLAGYLNTPTIFSGNPYMLTTVAAFVIGGNALSGEKGSVVATAIGVFFLIYLDQLLVSLGFPQSVQNLIQAAIVFAGVAIPELFRRLR